MKIAGHNPLPQTEITKKGKVIHPPLSRLPKTAIRPVKPYLVFSSIFFSSALSGAGAASFIGSAAGAAGAGSAGAAGGGGGGGAGSSFLPQPANIRVKANRVIADNDTNFFPILDSPPFPSHIFTKRQLLINFYYISPGEIQGELQPQPE
jgi:hypothetical protein